MNELKGSCTITAPEPETKPRQEPCYVQQQQDAKDTVPCSGDQALLNELLRLMGFDIPAPEQPKDYSTQIKVKPKNGYTDLNISFSDNVTTNGGRWEQSESTQTVSISSSDFVASEVGGYVDLAAKLNLVETDRVRSAKWIGTVYDSKLSPITISSIASVDSDNHLILGQAVNGELLVTFSETSQIFDVKVPPREDAEQNAYDSSMIVQPEGCEEQQPTRYEIGVADCYPDELVSVTVIDPPPEFVEPVEVERRWCLCGDNKLQGVYPKSAEPKDISNVCYGGPCNRITYCVPNDREEGDEYC